ncbi:hypothetical protein CDO51_01280 [Natranaerobius trueperi]|uniref:Arsenate reductase n=1 Tax=Natranaerobius trueperi TaxID=759412 RepID=A0A226C2Q7_9FIRM|nr:ArsC/Spx/MgsR family protein [Natranaerobius trueperi]OWZ84687.1 hypothetical protein CDO51_01280 [Natranaerobius trueperi]
MENYDLVKKPLSIDDIEKLANLTELGTKELLNKKSQAYKKAQLNESDMTDREIAQFLSENPRGIKRPIVTNGEDIVVGFDEEKLQKLI